MSNKRYILLDSTYRNRKEWPLPGQFEVEVSKSGARNIRNAQDPLSLAAPILCWKGNDFNKNPDGGGNSKTIELKLCPGDAPINESNSTTLLNLCVEGANFGKLHQEKNYYRGAMLKIECAGKPVEIHRIAEYTFTGNSNYERAFVRLYTPISQSLYQEMKENPDSCDITITDPTDVCSDPTNKLIFIPGGIQTTNSYINYVLYNETKCNYAYVTSTEDVTNITQVDKEKQPSCWRDDPSNPVFGDCPDSWSNDDNYCLRREPPSFVGEVGNNSDCESKANRIPIKNLNAVEYDCYFLRFKNNDSNPEELRGETLKIKEVCCPKPTVENPKPDPVLVVCSNFSTTPVEGGEIELLRINRDNEVFYNYSGSWLSQQQESCYQIELVTLILPNQTLKVGYGSRTAFYPYIILELENVCGSNAGIKNLVYSNNPYVNKALFVVPITDVNDPQFVPFIHLFGNGVVQTIKFKPNDNLKLTVRMPTGEIFETILDENFSPAFPNPLKQITAMFGIRKL